MIEKQNTMSNFDLDPHRRTPAGLRPGSDLPKWLWWGPAIALVIAVLPLPYGYYMALRLAVCAAAAFIAWKEYELNGKEANSYTWIFGIVAVLYNPFLPVHLFKLLWVVLNLGTAATFIGHYQLRLTRS